MWMRDYRIDGLRLDAVHAFVDRSAIHFLEQLSIEVEKLESTMGRRLVLIAESDLNDPRIVLSRECGGLGMDAQWSDDFHHALFTALSPHSEGGYYADFGSIAMLAKSGIMCMGEQSKKSRNIAFLDTYKITIRLAIGHWETGSAALLALTVQKLRRQLLSQAHLFR
jgi:1,4-alpha-glucan branching enzyme